MERLAAQLKALDSEVKESMIIARVLSKLTIKFSHFHSAWDSAPETKKNFDTLSSRLMAGESRLPKKDEIKSSAALTASSGGKIDQVQVNKNKLDGKRTVCYNCGKPRHLKKNCFWCYFYKEKGHRSFECKKKRQDNAGQQRSSNYAGNNNSDNSWQQDFGRKDALMGSRDQRQSDVWLINSGASDHMTSRREWFLSYEEFEVPEQISACNGSSINAYDKGNIDIVSVSNGKCVKGTLHDVLFLPNIVHNLFSVKAAGKKDVDLYVDSSTSKCYFKRDGEVIFTGSELGNLFKLDVSMTVPGVCYSAGRKNDSKD